MNEVNVDSEYHGPSAYGGEGKNIGIFSSYKRADENARKVFPLHSTPCHIQQ